MFRQTILASAIMLACLALSPSLQAQTAYPATLAGHAVLAAMALGRLAWTAAQLPTLMFVPMAETPAPARPITPKAPCVNPAVTADTSPDLSTAPGLRVVTT